MKNEYLKYISNIFDKKLFQIRNNENYISFYKHFDGGKTYNKEFLKNSFILGLETIQRPISSVVTVKFLILKTNSFLYVDIEMTKKNGFVECLDPNCLNLFKRINK